MYCIKQIFKNNLNIYMLLLTINSSVLICWMAYNLSKDDFWIEFNIPVRPIIIIPYDRYGLDV